MLAIRTVLHPTDFSPRAEYAFRLAWALARDYQARLVLLHVAEPAPIIAGEGVVMPPTAIDLDELRRRLESVAAPEAGVPIERRVVEGETVAEILRVAEETKADLLVVGTHGRTGLGRLLMGSVAEQILRRAPCPVLTVKAPAAPVPVAPLPFAEPIVAELAETEFVTATTLTDPLQAEMLRNALRDEGVACTLDGLHQSGAVGIPGAAEIRVQVPDHAFDRARKLIRAWEARIAVHA